MMQYPNLSIAFIGGLSLAHSHVTTMSEHASAPLKVSGEALGAVDVGLLNHICPGA